MTREIWSVGTESEDPGSGRPEDSENTTGVGQWPCVATLRSFPRSRVGRCGASEAQGVSGSFVFVVVIGEENSRSVTHGHRDGAGRVAATMSLTAPEPVSVVLLRTEEPG